MWKIVLAVFVVGVSATKYGHEPGAYNTPNLIPADSTEMNYVPTTKKYPPQRWYSIGITTEVINDASQCFDGNQCLKTINRQSDDECLYYRESYDNLEAGYTYMFNIFHKLIGGNSDLVNMTAFSRSWYRNATEHGGVSMIYTFYTRKAYKVEDQWLFFSMHQEITAQAKQDFSFIDFFVRVDGGVDYIMDAPSLTKVYYPDWKVDALNSITAHRMGTFQINYNIPAGVDPSLLKVKVKQTRKEFPFGMALPARFIGGNASDPYVQRLREYAKKRLTVATTINAVKWRPMEFEGRDDTDMKFEVADSAIDWFRSENIDVRGHAVHWNKQAALPNWVVPLNNKSAEIDRRTNYIVPHYKGKFIHWDVLNEFTNTRDYQDWLGREDVLEYLHGEVRKLDPDVKRFTNEWGNLQRHYHFADSVTAILRLKKAGLIEGIGLQAHFKPQEYVLDMNIIKRRLDIFANMGLDVWITEHTVKDTDQQQRAAVLGDCMTLFYGTPNVKGFLIWDPAPTNNPRMVPCALLDSNLNNTPAGDKFDELMETWETNTDVVFSDPTGSVSTAAYYGLHDVTLYYNDVEIAKVSDVKLTSQNTPVQLNCGLAVHGSMTLSQQ